MLCRVNHKIQVMKTKIKRVNEADRKLKLNTPVRLYNPNGIDKLTSHCVRSVEATDEYTRIDFIYRSSMIYDNGGWIQMEADAYIQPVGSDIRYRLVKAINITIAPTKLYFKKQGEYHTYTLIFPPLPRNTTKINIIEKLAPGTYFNFFNVDYSKWMTVPNLTELTYKEN